MPTDKDIHVLFLARWYPHRYDPMFGLFVERHAEAVAEFCKVSVLYVHQDFELKGKSHEITTESKNGIFCIRIYHRAPAFNIPLLTPILKTLRYWHYNRKGIRRVIKSQGEIDINHVHVMTRLGVVALFRRIFHKTPYIITEHWSRYLPITNTYKGFFRKLATKLVVRNAGAVCPVTNNLKQALLGHKLRNRNYHIIPNVVDILKFTPGKPDTGKQKKEIVHISCFEDRSKNISGILRVVKKLAEKRDDFTLKLVGDGFNLDDMKEYAKQLNIPDNRVHFTGLLEGDDLVTSLRQADFMLMFSNYENMPVVINESFACGIPVVSTNVGGISEVVNDENGILVEKGDEKELLEALEKMLDKSDNYDPDKLREYAVGKFSNQVVGKQYYNIYRSQVERRS